MHIDPLHDFGIPLLGVVTARMATMAAELPQAASVPILHPIATGISAALTVLAIAYPGIRRVHKAWKVYNDPEKGQVAEIKLLRKEVLARAETDSKILSEIRRAHVIAQERNDLQDLMEEVRRDMGSMKEHNAREHASTQQMFKDSHEELRRDLDGLGKVARAHDQRIKAVEEALAKR
jgi:hypothetical protein